MRAIANSANFPEVADDYRRKFTGQLSGSVEPSTKCTFVGMYQRVCRKCKVESVNLESTYLASGPHHPCPVPQYPVLHLVTLVQPELYAVHFYYTDMLSIAIICITLVQKPYYVKNGFCYRSPSTSELTLSSDCKVIGVFDS
jgi:hypothetical protein